jgi:WD40 repeat protein
VSVAGASATAAASEREVAPSDVAPFDVFISYASDDRGAAIALQRELERFRVPRSLVGTAGAYGLVPARIGRVFLDRTDLSAAPGLTDGIVAALARSRALVVLCSNAAANPARWVNREIAAYRRVRPEGRIFAIILRDEPPGCFPAELIAAADGGHGQEPLAADMRPHGDGPREAMVKLAAGLLGVDFDLLRRRRAEAERRRRRIVFGIAAVYALTMTGALIGVTSFALDLMASRRTAVAVEAKRANEIDRPDVAMLLAGIALPSAGSVIEPAIPAARAQALRALFANRLENVVPAGKATLMAVDGARNRAYLAPYEGTVTALELPSGRPLADWTSPSEDALALAISADGSRLARATANGRVVVLDADTGAELMRSEPTGSVGRSIAFAADGGRIVIGDAGGTARVFALAERCWLSHSPEHRGSVDAVAFSPDGTRVLSGSLGGTVIEWDAATGDVIRSRDGNGSINAILRPSPGAPWAATTTGNMIRLWPSEAAADPSDIVLPAAGADVRISADGATYVASSWLGKAAYLVDIGSRRVIAKLAHPNWVRAAAFFDGDQRLATLGNDGALRVWRNPRLDLPREVHRFSQSGPILVGWRPDGRTVVASGGGPSRDLAIVTAEAASGGRRALPAPPCSGPGRDPNCWINAFAVSPDGSRALYASAAGRLALLDVATGRELWARELPGDWVQGVAFRPAANEVLVQRSRGEVEALALTSGATLRTFASPADPGPQGVSRVHTERLALDPTGAFLAEGGLTGVVVRRLADGVIVWQAGTFGWYPAAVAWSPDGRTLAAGTVNAVVHLFEPFNDQPPRTLRGHGSWVFDLSFSPDSRFIVSTSEREQIVWDMASGEEVERFAAIIADGTANATAGRFSPDGRSIALADGSGSVRVVGFPAPDGDLRTALCTALPQGRSTFSREEMNEFGFLDASESAPCARPPLLSVANIGLTLRGWSDRALRAVGAMVGFR